VEDVSYPNQHALGDDVATAGQFSPSDRIQVNRGAVCGIAAHPDGSKLFVINHADDSVSAIDTETGAPVETLTGIDEPFAVAISGTRAYVSTVSAAYDAIVAIDVDTDRVVAKHPVEHSVRDLAVSPDGRRVYACRTAAGGADIVVLDTESGGAEVIDLAAQAAVTTECVRVSPDGSRLYVAIDGPAGAALAVIDTDRRQVVGAVQSSLPVRDVAVSPCGGTVYLLSCGADFCAVLDAVDTTTHRVTGTAKFAQVNGLAAQLALSSDGARAYLVGERGVVVLSTASQDVIGTIAVGVEPSCVTESPDGKRLYVADYGGAISVFATTG
jgi:YVTN family beta-propeller protein